MGDNSDTTRDYRLKKLQIGKKMESLQEREPGEEFVVNDDDDDDESTVTALLCVGSKQSS